MLNPDLHKNYKHQGIDPHYVITFRTDMTRILQGLHKGIFSRSSLLPSPLGFLDSDPSHTLDLWTSALGLLLLLLLLHVGSLVLAGLIPRPDLHP